MDSKQKQGKRSYQHLHQFGLMDIPDVSDINELYGDDADDDDADLEAELAALTAGQQYTKPKHKPHKSLLLDLGDIEALGADIPDEELSGDDDDPALLAELMELEDGSNQAQIFQSKGIDAPVTAQLPAPIQPVPAPRSSSQSHVPPAPEYIPPSRVAPPPPSTNNNTANSERNSIVSLLNSRQKLYAKAVAQAESAGDTSKARRFQRGSKTIDTLLKAAIAGKEIDESDIPPEVALPGDAKKIVRDYDEKAGAKVDTTEQMISIPAEPVTPDPSSSQVDNSHPDLTLLKTRRDQYKLAALQAKNNGDRGMAVQCLKTVKQFDAVIQAAVAGNPVDLSGMPPPPKLDSQTKQTGEVKVDSPVIKERSQGTTNPVIEEPLPDYPTDEKDEKALFHAPDAPSSVADALQQRLDKYINSHTQASAEGNASKARRMGRIVKQYQKAIKDYTAGKPLNFEELPVPPGFAPIPTDTLAEPSRKPSSSSLHSASSASSLKRMNEPHKSPVPKPAPRQTTPIRLSVETGKHGSSASPGKPELVKRKSLSKQEQQMKFLVERHQLFKEAALDAKKRGDIMQAKEYIRKMKGFEPMMDACRNGLPVDITKVPSPPQLKSATVQETIHTSGQGGDREEMYKKLEHDLVHQLKVCTANSQHCVESGEVAAAGKYDKMAENCRKDLDALKYAFKHGDPVPKFHYDTRMMSVIRACKDLGDDDLELTIIRGISYSCSDPKDLDTYIRWEFPYPSDSPQRGKTHTVKETSNPDYDCKMKMEISRKSRAFLRIVKRQHIRLEIYAKGGFLRSDNLIGTVKVPLAPLERVCTIHNCYDLMDGKKKIGGQLEAKIRVRNPFLNKEVEETKEKWLIIEKYL